MARKQYTKEEKDAYFQQLRDQWKAAKKMAEVDEIKALYMETGLNISVTNFAFVLSQMQAQEMDGIPYIDAKTYRGWKESGFQVMRGEKSTLHGLTWIDAGGDDGDESDEENSHYVFPKVYNLFHRSQVEEIGGKEESHE